MRAPKTKAEIREEARSDLEIVFKIIVFWVVICTGMWFYPLQTLGAILGIVLIWFARWVVKTAWAAFGPFGDEDEEDDS